MDAESITDYQVPGVVKDEEDLIESNTMYLENVTGWIFKDWLTVVL